MPVRVVRGWCGVVVRVVVKVVRVVWGAGKGGEGCQ